MRAVPVAGRPDRDRGDRGPIRPGAPTSSSRRADSVMSASWSATNSTSVSPKSSFRSRRTLDPGGPSDGTTERPAVVCEVTDKVDLSAWPDGTRMIARAPCPPAPSSRSPTRKATGSRCVSPTWPTPTSPTSKRFTVAVAVSNRPSRTETPACEPPVGVVRDQPGVGDRHVVRPGHHRLDPTAVSRR